MHGAGMCATSFAPCAKEIRKFAKVVAFDFRGHGFSKHPEGDADLSIDTLVKDAITFIDFIMAKHASSTFIMMGHSMGGSVAAKVGKVIEGKAEYERVRGLIIIDVSEGVAIEALPHMHQILAKKPKKFSKIDDAVRWR